MNRYLEIKNINKTFKKKQVLIDLSYKFLLNNIYCIKGRNGSGKSTLFKILLGILKQDGGQVILNNLCVSGLLEEACGNNWIKAKDQLVYLLGNDIETIKKIDDYAKLFCIEDSLETNFSNLSLGMKQKICLIYALINKCDVLILDEPTISLDTQSCDILKDLLENMKKDNKIIIISSHDSYFINKINDKVILQLDNGQLIEKEKNELINISIECRNKDIINLFMKNDISYDSIDNIYNFECNEGFVFELMSKREEYEIINILYR